jgi:hypothetical protein
MKQILIEKYIEPSEIKTDRGYIFEHWLNRNGDLHSFMGQPSEICYYNWESKEIRNQYWDKKGVEHRDKNLPSAIFYEDGKIKSKYWYKNGIEIKKETFKI